MCNLNILYKTNNEGLENLFNSFINSTAISFINNNHGEGIYFNSSNKVYKSEYKINLLNHLKEFKNSNTILSHQRIATSGKSNKYLQPFQKDNFILLHNGIMRQFEKGKTSDTYNFFKKFIKEVKKANGSRDKKIITAIKKLLDNRSFCSFSILIYDKLTKNSYYFKNNQTDIKFLRKHDKTNLFISTEKDNEDFLNLYYNDFNEIHIKDLMIYRIYRRKEKIRVKPISKIKERVKPIRYNNYYMNSFNAYGYTKTDRDKETEILNNFKRRWGFQEIKEKGFCSMCFKETHNFNNKKGFFVCDECLLEYGEQVKNINPYNTLDLNQKNVKPNYRHYIT